MYIGLLHNVNNNLTLIIIDTSVDDEINRVTLFIYLAAILTAD